ncbi:MAG TPA: nuclear transport factor 2 family protein [Longimicrobium sp.]|nr:nuclear transport factor 2 family protein [Longimicrobium sp.]
MRRIVRSTLAAAALALAWAAPAEAQAATAADSAAIRAAALDYVEGWYAGDGERMRRALHPGLAKRIVMADSTGTPRLQQMTADELVAATGRGGGRRTPAERQEKEVRILDVFGNTASVRATMSGWIDYMHLAKWEGRWVIVNVLWELKPRA